jgi:hypothetical protein
MSVSPESASEKEAELARLRAEIAALQAGHEPPDRRVTRGRWRPVVSVALVALGCLLLIPATAAAWLQSVVTDSDRYVETVAPLANDPAVQEAVTNRITNEIFSRLDVAQVVDETAQLLAEQGARPLVTSSLQGLAGPIAEGIEDWVRGQVSTIVASDAFASTWTQANRVAHRSLVAVMTGRTPDSGLVVQNDTISIELGPFLTEVKEALVAAGFTLAERIPAVEAEFVLFQSESITTARSGFRAVDRLGAWLPIGAVALIAVGVIVARDRRRALVAAGAGAAVAMLAIGVALAVARPLYLEALPPPVNRYAAAAVFDQVVTFLRTNLRAVLALGLILALVAFLSGPSRAAALRRGIAGLGRRTEHQGWRTGPVATWLRRHRRPVQVAVVIAAGLALVFWSYPTPAVILSIALIAVVLVAAVEIAGAEPRGGPPASPVPGEAHVPAGDDR